MPTTADPGQRRPAPVAPPDAERLACLFAGGVLALLGLRRGGPAGAGLVVAGGALALRGVTGPSLLGEDGGRGLLRAGLAKVERAVPATRTVKIRRSVTIGRPREEVWRFVRDLANFPRFARHVESVTPSGDGGRVSRWVVRGPGGTRLEWDAEIEREVEGERISWNSVPGADIRNAGVLALRDAPGGRGTEVHLRLAYDAPAGTLGRIVAGLLGEEPELQAREDLGRLKMLLETGEAATNAMRRADAGRESF
jgi:uncharacterized membrane protein